jgi:hypothetical protein
MRLCFIYAPVFYLTFISLFKERSRLCFIYAPVFYLTFISMFKEPVFLSLFIADLYALSKGEVAGTASVKEKRDRWQRLQID